MFGCHCNGSHHLHRHTIRDLETIKCRGDVSREEGLEFCSLDLISCRGLGQVKTTSLSSVPTGEEDEDEVRLLDRTTEVMASHFFQRSFILSSALSLSFFLSWA